MKTQLVACLLAAIAIAGIAASFPPAAGPIEVAEIDFISLHSQANAALQTLQISQAQRLALPQARAY